MRRARRQGNRKRYILSPRFLALIVIDALIIGFLLGFAVAFGIWWNN
jgi:hypothetical protein